MTPRAPVTNDDVARTLDRVAELLELEGANPFRVHAYRRTADRVRELAEPVTAALAREGPRSLGVGPSMGALLEELTSTGRLQMLERLEAELPPVERLSRLAGLGPALAKRVHDTLHVETLEDLEVAAHDGSLAKVPGFGARRTELIRQQLDGLLGRRRRGRRPSAPDPGTAPPDRPNQHPWRPPVAQLLEIDAEYLAKAQQGALVKLAPRRFNPGHEAWLPVMHLTRDGVRFTALFSNTARAHHLNATHDWVVIYWGHDHQESQCTVVTELKGPLAGKRVVRGREAECARHYRAAGVPWSSSGVEAEGRVEPRRTAS